MAAVRKDGRHDGRTCAYSNSQVSSCLCPAGPAVEFSVVRTRRRIAGNRINQAALNAGRLWQVMTKELVREIARKVRPRSYERVSRRRNPHQMT